jgi:hypothetical protein
MPIDQAGLLLLGLLALAGGYALARRLLLRPAPMHRLRYVARLRGPLALRLAGGALLTVLLLIVARLIAAAGHQVLDPTLLAIDSFAIQGTIFLLALALAALLTASALALVPHKLLVFEDELRLKFRAYRTRRWRADEISELRAARFSDVFLSRRAVRTLPLALGVRAPGLLIGTRHGPDLFVATRDTAELERVIRQTLWKVVDERTAEDLPAQAAVSSSQYSP